MTTKAQLIRKPVAQVAEQNVKKPQKPLDEDIMRGMREDAQEVAAYIRKMKRDHAERRRKLVEEFGEEKIAACGW